MATHYTNALPSDTLPNATLPNATLPNLTTNGFRSIVQSNTEPFNKRSVIETSIAQINLVEENTLQSELLQSQSSQQDILLAYTNKAKTQIQIYHIDVFVGGLLIGTHLPKIGWMMLSYAATFPVLIAFQHPEFFIQLYKKNPEQFIILVSALTACQLYALFCIRNLIL